MWLCSIFDIKCVQGSILPPLIGRFSDNLLLKYRYKAFSSYIQHTTRLNRQCLASLLTTLTLHKLILFSFLIWYKHKFKNHYINKYFIALLLTKPSTFSWAKFLSLLLGLFPSKLIDKIDESTLLVCFASLRYKLSFRVLIENANQVFLTLFFIK